jgi:hypothetical protein
MAGVGWVGGAQRTDLSEDCLTLCNCCSTVNVTSVCVKAIGAFTVRIQYAALFIYRVIVVCDKYRLSLAVGSFIVLP